jgi:hypothetical protein
MGQPVQNSGANDRKGSRAVDFIARPRKRPLWQLHVPACLERSLGNWLAGRNAVYQLTAMDIIREAQASVARHNRALELD